MTREEIAKILQDTRLKAGFTQKQAAESIGRKQQTLASWETGQSQPDANTLFVLFDVYGASVDDAFGFSYKKNITINKSDEEIINAIHMLNKNGQAKVKEYIDDIVKSGKYLKHDKKIRLLNEQTDDEIVEFPVVARSGERTTIKTTKAKLEADLAKLKPTDEEDL